MKYEVTMVVESELGPENVKNFVLADLDLVVHEITVRPNRRYAMPASSLEENV